MLKTLLDDQRCILNQFFDRINLSDAEKILEKFLACQGNIILSGVGKSGHIAEKIAATLVSTGTRAAFLSPAHALHGDIGCVSAGDVFVSLSKSGASSELLELLPYIQKRGASTIAIVSAPDAPLAKRSDLSIILPVEREICPYDLAPTTSSAAQLIFGDCLAIALMQAKRFGLADFAANHPGGLLGRKITLKVSDLMLKGDALPLCQEADLLIDVLHELSAKKCGCLLVTDGAQRLRGIFTDGDLRRAIQSQGPKALQRSVSQLMTSSPKSIASGQLILEAVQHMGGLITVLPVLEQGRVVGLIRMHDILPKEFS